MQLPRPSRFISFTAACVVLLQVAVSAWATGATAGALDVDAFGNPLCITSSDAGFDRDTGAPSGDHSKLPNCCTFGCGMVSPPLVPRDTHGVALSPPTSGIELSRQSSELFPARDAGYVPGNPRAPPTRA